MTEAAFPLLGAAFALLVVLPASALLAKGLLLLASHAGSRSGLHALALRYVLLVGTICVPLAWLVSAGIHQAETGRSAVACLLDHGQSDDCGEAALFTLLLAGAVFGLARRRPSRSPHRDQDTRTTRRLGARIDQLVHQRVAIAPLYGRVRVIEASEFGAIATTGWFKPRVVIEADFASRLDDDELVGALAHELEHIRGYDPLRYALLALTLRMCPFGRLLLGREAAQWLVARETHCDREAVRRGADAAALAQALVSAARPKMQAPIAALAGLDVASLRLRVELLLSYSEDSSSRPRGRAGLGLLLVVAALFAAALLPHVSGTHALDVIHAGAEGVLD